MILSVEVGLIHRECVDEVLYLLVGVRPQNGEVRLERCRSCGRNPLRKSAIDVVALAAVKGHARPPIEKFTESSNILLGKGDGAMSVSIRTGHS